MTRRAHGRSHGFVGKANLERLLDCELIVSMLEHAVLPAAENASRADAVLLFHLSLFGDTLAAVEICHLYISRSHNFFGHHGREPDEYPAVEVPMIECVAGHGIHGDRFFDYQDDYKGQITFFAAEIFDELCNALDLQDCSPALVRRNVITRDVDLNELIDREFEVQGVRFHGTGECRPCYWMDRVIAPGAEEFLKGRGGLRAKIIADGELRSASRIAQVVG